MSSQLEGELPEGARVEGTALMLPAVRLEDAGVYACAASNRRGQETAFYVLKVQGKYWTDRLGGAASLSMLRPMSPQSAWCLTSHRRPAPSCRCPPSRMPTRPLRSRSPSGLMLPMVSTVGAPWPPMPDRAALACSHSFSLLLRLSVLLSISLPPLALILYSGEHPPRGSLLSLFPGVCPGHPALWLCSPCCVPIGMLLYNGQRKSSGADFISFGLVGGRPEFR